LIRRNNFDGVDVIAINEITLFPDERRVLINNGPINLTSKEFDLLVYFIANKNRVIQKNALVEHLWGDSADQFDNFDLQSRKTLERNCLLHIVMITFNPYTA
jgi:DNA-binding response OmpR family regulator